MTAYTKSTNFATKDTLTSGDPLKIVKGTEINTEFDNIATSVNSKSDTASPTFTGTVTIPTVSVSGTTDSTSTSTGSVVTAGGLGVAKAAFIGTTLNVASTTTLTGVATLTANPVLSAGTANGVTYLNGSKSLSSGSAITFDGTNFATTGTATAAKLIPTGTSVTGNGLYLPAANALGLSTNGTNAVYIDSSQNVGIGTSSPTYKLDVKGGIRSGLVSTTTGSLDLFSASNDTQMGILNNATEFKIYSTYASTAGYKPINFYTSDALKMTLNANGALALAGGNASATGVGIAFPATQSASTDANTLDDYEEGTFTAVVTMVSGTATVASGNDLMSYTKVGRLVTINGQFEISAVSSPSGVMKITLPFSVANGSEGSALSVGGAMRIFNAALPAGLYPVIQANNNDNTASLFMITSAGNLTNMLPIAGHFFMITLTYIV